MLTPLFGNPNIERILLFLFVNEKCYGNQLKTLLRVPLTPIQKGLERLEKGGVIQSHFEGKMRIYQFHPSYPLKVELEILLKKAYTLLPAQEKKRYCFIHKSTKKENDHNTQNELLVFWKKLGEIKHLRFTTKSKKGEEKIMQTGVAEVIITTPTPHVYMYQEKGFWMHNGLPTSGFSNQFRWTLNTEQGLISLEHLRYGFNHPVFLFHLRITKPYMLESVDAHLCGGDTYLGNMSWNQKAIHLHQRVIGQNKNDELLYQYH